jgi:hypothetical protein
MTLLLKAGIVSPYILIRVNNPSKTHVQECKCEMCTITRRLRNKGKI